MSLHVGIFAFQSRFQPPQKIALHKELSFALGVWAASPALP